MLGGDLQLPKEGELEHSPFKYQNGVVARIVSSVDGGPLRRIINGRATKPTGAFVAIKAGRRAMPWESMRCELPALELAEVGSPVIALLSQPHRLEIFVRGQGKPLRFFPDMALTVEQELFEALRKKVPFGEAVLGWRPNPRRKRTIRKVILEIKDDDDPRNGDKDYQRKLWLAAQVYRRVGTGFFTIVRSRDLECIDLDFIRDVAIDARTAVRAVDTDSAIQCILDSGGIAARFADIVTALGGGALGRAKAIALHVRRVIAIDMTQGLLADGLVWPIQGHDAKCTGVAKSGMLSK